MTGLLLFGLGESDGFDGRSREASWAACRRPARWCSLGAQVAALRTSECKAVHHGSTTVYTVADFDEALTSPEASEACCLASPCSHSQTRRVEMMQSSIAIATTAERPGNTVQYTRCACSSMRYYCTLQCMIPVLACAEMSAMFNSLIRAWKLEGLQMHTV